MPMKRCVIAAALLAATAVPLLLAALPTAPAAAAGATQEVMISNFAFAPSSFSVTVGTTAQWTNHDTAPHDVTVTSGPVAIHSPTLSTGQSWSYDFTVAGTYNYICSIHPDMHGAFTVRPAVPEPNTPPSATVSSHTDAAQPNTAPLGLAGQTQPGRTAHVATRRARPAAAGTQPAPAATTTVTVAAAASTPSTARELKPLLIIAGVVAAIATFCLLLLASAPDTPSRT